MTRINRLGGPGRAVAVGRERLREAGSEGFALPEIPRSPAEAETIRGAAPATLLGALLALQEAEVSGTRDRAAQRHGETMLAQLKALQLGLLGGAADPGALKRLARLAEELPEAADPTLAALVEAVVLRARVELARGSFGAE